MITNDFYLQVRHVAETEEGSLIMQMLSAQTESANRSIFEYRECLEDHCRLLLNMAADESLCVSRRQLCLDHIHRPLAALSNLADCEFTREKVTQLASELQIVSHSLTPRPVDE